MDKKEFVKMLNLLIDQKIKKLVPELVKEEIKNMKPIIQETTTISDDFDLKSILEYDATDELETIKEQKVAPKVDKDIVFTKDASINSILQQTAAEMKNAIPSDEGVSDAYKRLLSEEYSDVTTPSSQATSGVKTKPSTEKLKRELVGSAGHSAAAQKVADVMVKDYSGFMKKVAKKSKQTRG